MTSTSFADLTEESGLKAHLQYFILWPEKWQTYTPIHTWDIFDLDITNRDEIPTSSGIYSLILEPCVAGNTSCSYLFYIGRTNNLHRRFNEYLTKERHARPKISMFLARYNGHICFCYTLIPESRIKCMEIGITNAYLPPLNEIYEGEISSTMRAFP